VAVVGPVRVGAVYIIAHAAHPVRRARPADAGPGARAFAQDNTTGRCATPDSVAVTGNSRVTETDVRASGRAGRGVPLNAPFAAGGDQESLRHRAVRGCANHVQHPPVPTRTRAYTLLISVKERLVMSGVDVTGAKRISSKTLHDLSRPDTWQAASSQATSRGARRGLIPCTGRGTFWPRSFPRRRPSRGKSSIVFHIDEGGAWPCPASASAERGTVGSRDRSRG